MSVSGSVGSTSGTMLSTCHSGRPRMPEERFLTARAAAFLEMRRATRTEWVFPAPTRRGHIEKIQPEETTCEGVQTGEGRRIRPLYFPAHVSHAVGCLHGPVHPRIPRRTSRLLHYPPLRSPASGHSS